MRTLAYYDSLTGLPNRIFFQERLRDALEQTSVRGGCIALMFLDLDRFKDINDTLGHALGDRFLQLFGERLVLLVKDRGIAARLGGDEFVVLLTKCSGDAEAREIAEEIIASAERPYRIEGYEQYITASIGIAVFPAHGRNDQVLIKNADIAMYRAKEQGRNAYFFYDETLEAPIRTRLAQEHELRRALKNEEFILQYQPILEASEGNRAIGVEALIRWNHPVQGLLGPDAFIPSAEATGLIVPLGEWVQHTAAARMREWQKRFGKLLLAINMSARQFHQRDLCDRLLEIVTSEGLDPETIEVEITESMALFDAENAVETIRSLKRIGAKIAIDDFGTGHSSLNYLRRFDADHIKVDRSFVAGIGGPGSDDPLITAIVAMGHSLGLQIIAEGVETPQQYEFLRAQGCDLVQGNLFAPPMHPEELEVFLTGKR
jgi:diguanylate cyclase (GGDEF)-like protein